MNSQNTNKLVQVDAITWMNVIFIVIVLCLHQVNYTVDYLWELTHRFFHPYHVGLDQVLQKFAVGGFLFLSGLKLSLAKSNEPAWDFLKKRFWRIYPLYLLAVILFSFTVYPHITGELPNLGNFLIHAFALQSWFPNLFQANYLTIWFVSNLFFCYLSFLILRKSLSDVKRFSILLLAISSGIYLVRAIFGNWFGLSVLAGHFDTYFIFFACGMLCSQGQSWIIEIRGVTFLGLALCSTICFLALTFINITWVQNSLIYYVAERCLVMGFTIPFYLLLMKRFHHSTVSVQKAALLKYINVSALCIFLFHRPIWTIMNTIWPEESYLQSLFILGLGIPIICVVAYQIQTVYSRKLFPIFMGLGFKPSRSSSSQ